MLSPRTGRILNFIVGQYITRVVPVPSQSIAAETDLRVSPATIRNEMAHLEEEGYIFRPHTSAGSVPSDKGYRYYVESLQDATLPTDDQRMVSHLFHRVEEDVENWLGLAATLLSHLVKNVAVVTTPKQSYCTFKHLELVSLQEVLALMVLVLQGARVKQQLITFNRAVEQAELTAVSIKLNAAYAGLTSRQITTRNLKLSPTESQITDYIIKIMQAEDEKEMEASYLDGLHFILDQPEFAQSHQMLSLMELVEQRSLLKTLGPVKPSHRVQVIIGRENQAEALHNYSVVITEYGLPEEAVGKVCVIGPTRMAYAQTIPTVGYLSLVLSQLVAGLYGRRSTDSSATN
ncbi:MAG: heat-inducible transcriptional repressor HrcA [Chloroflexota bacterium]